jgi:hypothetical protein
MDKVGIYTLWPLDKFNHRKAFQNLFPQNDELHFRQAIPDAAMDPKAKRQVMARPGAIDNEMIWPIDRFFITITGDIPHNDFVTGADALAAELGVRHGGAAHMHDR